MKISAIFTILLLLIGALPSLSSGEQSLRQTEANFRETDLEFFHVIQCVEGEVNSGWCADKQISKNKKLTILDNQKNTFCEANWNGLFEITTEVEGIPGTKLLTKKCSINEQGIMGIAGTSVHSYSNVLMRSITDNEKIKSIHEKLIRSKAYRAYIKQVNTKSARSATDLPYMRLTQHPAYQGLYFINFIGNQWRPVFLFLDGSFHLIEEKWGAVESTFELNGKFIFCIGFCQPDTDACSTHYFESYLKSDKK